MTEKQVTISMNKLKLIAQFYGIPIVVFFDTTSEDDLQRWIQKHGTADRVTWKYYDAVKKIKEIVDELYTDNENY
jgi:hypothetical protein